MGLLYFIRHGENYANITKEFSYSLVDYSLTPKGVMQAAQCAQYMQQFHVTKIFSSPLKRARETAQAIGQQSDIPIEIIEAFREINVGDLERRPPTPETWNEYFAISQAWKDGHPEMTFPGGENKWDLLSRFTQGLRQVLDNTDGEPAIIVGHGGQFVEGLAEVCQNVDRQFFRTRDWPNCGVTSCEFLVSGSNLHGILISYGIISFLQGVAAELESGLPKFIQK